MQTSIEPGVDTPTSHLTHKKWFIYLQDHHEGPFSQEELQSKIDQHLISRQTYVWTEGMPDWQVLYAVEALLSLQFPERPSTKNTQQPHFTQNGSTSYSSTQGLEGVAGVEKMDTQDSKNSSSFGTPHPGQSESQITSWFQRFKGPKWTRIMHLFSLSIFLLGIFFIWNYELSDATGLKFTLQSLLRNYLPWTRTWISPLPYLEDVTPQERHELQEIVRHRGKTEEAFSTHPTVGLAQSLRSEGGPIFYLASHQGQPMKLSLYVIGIPHTLLHVSPVSEVFPIEMSDHFMKTPPLHLKDGQALPKGDYLVYLTTLEPAEQPTSHLLPQTIGSTSGTLSTPDRPVEIPPHVQILATKTYFLGGERNKDYFTQLDELHLRLKEEAALELREAKQVRVTLEHQLRDTIEKFSHIRRTLPLRTQQSVWSTFHASWNALQEQLYPHFTRELLPLTQQKPVYAPLIPLFQQADQAVQRVHQLQGAIFSQKFDVRTLEVQWTEAAALAEDAVRQLKTQLEQLEKLPTPKSTL